MNNYPDNLISIIVPAYNAEKIISRCMDSLLKQSYSSFEIILINDGSTDRTGEIADTYSAQDGRVKVVHKTNGGVSSARNKGLEIANGKWITFVDVDDWVDIHFLESLLSNEKVDLVVGGYHTEGNGQIREVRYDNKIVSKGHGIEDVLQNHITDMTFLCPWGKLFSRKLIQNNNLKFNTHMHIGEDVVFVWTYVSLCRNILLSEGQNYYYYTEQADFKYAIDGPKALSTIKCILKPLFDIKDRFEVNVDEAVYFIYNYYIWLYKLYIKKYYTIKDLSKIDSFFIKSSVFEFFKKYKNKSKDKYLVYSLLNFRMIWVLYILIKIRY